MVCQGGGGELGGSLGLLQAGRKWCARMGSIGVCTELEHLREKVRLVREDCNRARRA
jgi:hypothetical protein